jgi:UDP-glucose 4-epimerase
MVVIWAAGTAGVGSSEAEAERENEVLREVVDALGNCWPDTGGSFFLTSSAGAVYAGADDAPFSAESPTRGNSPYGRSKLWQEDFVRSALPSSVDVHIGRLGNIYGPTSTGRQGLIPRLCAAALSRRAMNLFVPLDTLRDYCFVDDAASLIWREILQQESERTTTVIASGRSVSVSEVVSTVQQVAHRKVPIALGSDPEADRQPIDLRLTPDWLTSYPEFQPIDLGTGIKRIIDDLAIASHQ